MWRRLWKGQSKSALLRIFRGAAPEQDVIHIQDILVTHVGQGGPAACIHARPVLGMCDRHVVTQNPSCKSTTNVATLS